MYPGGDGALLAKFYEAPGAGIATTLLESLPITNPKISFAKQILDHFDLMKYFDLAAGATMDYSRAKKGQVIAYALESFGVTDTSECIMVGDRDQDVNGAREQGFDCIGVLYGYGDREELEGAGARYLAESVEDILKFI